ncbi:unnamed protein product [Trifolium pratense]|uniref:Uncharacterized protein n=1 Tax=Trifolium pratense TaxID=57577 RepID=A0ACB0LWR6_TRIPR|nr:unnamed protein product [Trifolium pratense]
MKAWMKNLEKYLRSLVSLMSLLRRKLIRIRFSVDKAYQTAGVRFEVLCAVNKTEKVEEVAPELLEMSRKRRKFVHLLTFFLWILLGLLSLLCSLESAEHTTKGK